jgi:citrate lyase beta subunit
MHVSYLYTPALRIDSLIASRQNIIADAIVVDLEDSIHVNAKADARARVAELDVSLLTERGLRLGIRINTIASSDGMKDLELLLQLGAKGRRPYDVVLLPQVGHANEVKVYKQVLGALQRPPEVYPFIETTEAVENVEGIAAVSDALCFGQADLVAELYSPNESYLNDARARMCVAAARHQLQAIDTNSFEIEDMVRFESECVAAKGDGFTGKAAIHPRQVAAINAVFSVTAAQLSRYRAVIDAYQRSDVGFAIVDGQVIAPPFVAKARRMLELYDRYQSHGKEPS